ncbi:hypothetical protein RxyAA322_00250 [Rubrobacter xylanophilus]|uniref:Probable endolytic peptidoglycan transglycosylase RlpA n=1 Tax=Rubrobacter xylanophilus TaxID=49319 RepID=A0A510HE07_9ACTN|nr:septal ring lytic transglycosylase RlpA family protein [Rubrobacter xylanophilus]BBL78171.1 hypothetical protein RxyAA322_00250 [Rubrobacter xylanophilus]
MSGTRSASLRTLLLGAGFAGALLALLLVAGGVARAQQMTATWYGPGFEGSTTASGEPFDPSDYTAAHKTLPFGTKLIVTYNGRSVVVRVNDRGPYSGGHDLDLSQAAAEYLGLTAVGSAVVNVEFADPSTPTGPYSGGQQQPAPAQQEQPVAAQPQPGQAGGSPEAAARQGVASPEQPAASEQYAEEATEQYAEEQSAAPEQYEEERPAADPGQRAGGQYDGEEPSPEPVSGLNLKGALQGIAEDPGAARNWIELAEAAAPVQAGLPDEIAGAETGAAETSDGKVSSSTSSTLGISVLPDTGGASAVVLAGIGVLTLAGLAVGRGIFRR